MPGPMFGSNVGLFHLNQVGCLSIFDLNMAWNNPAFIY